jgi:hypothetical protein
MAHLYAPEIDASMSSHKAPPHEITVERLPSPDRTCVTDQPIDRHASGMAAIKGTAAPARCGNKCSNRCINLVLRSKSLISPNWDIPMSAPEESTGACSIPRLTTRNPDIAALELARRSRGLRGMNDGLTLKLGVNPGFNIIPKNQIGGQRDLL